MKRRRREVARDRFNPITVARAFTTPLNSL